MSNPNPSLADPRDSSVVKKRRGRQPRQSLVTPPLRDAIAKFASVVGAPVLQPGGFRDFTGWLETISSPKFRPAWLQLSQAFLLESSSTHHDHIYQLKRDVVHEIINLVVKRKAHESSKLVSTNARRQSSIPPSGSTVMTIFESYLAVASSHYPATRPTPSADSSMLRRQQSVHMRELYHSSLRSSRHTKSSDSRSSKSSSSSSGGRPSASSMDIAALLSAHDVDDFARSGSTRSMLPSLSQLDAQLRARSEKERRGHR